MNNPTREQKLDAARTRMAELGARFLDRTATDIAAMRADLGKLSSGEAAALGEIRHLAHRMVGTGATLGFESISDRALRIEQLAESCAPGSVPDAATREQIGVALEALAQEFDRQRTR